MDNNQSESNTPEGKPVGSRWSKLSLIIAGLVLLSLLFWAGRVIYLKIKYPETDLISAVPGSTILFAEGTGFMEFMEQLSQGSLWSSGFAEEGAPDHFATLAAELKKFGDGGNEIVSALMQDQRFGMALVPKKTGGPALLFAIQLKHGLRPELLHNALKQAWPSYSEKKLLEITYHERVMPDGSPLYVTIRDGILIASADREVFELSYYTIGSGNSLDKDPAFTEVRDIIAKSQNPATRVFLSYDGFYTWIARFIREEKKPLLASLPDMGTWAALELTFNESGAHLQGFTGIATTRPGLASTMQPSGRILKDPGMVLPANTIFYDQMAINSFGEFDQNYLQRYLKERESRNISYPVHDSILDLVRNVLALGEIQSYTVAATAMTDTSEGSNYLICLESERSAALFEGLLPFCDTTDTMVYQGYALQEFKYPYLIPALFGSGMHPFEEAHMAVSGEWVVIAPNRRGLLSVINALTLNRMLGHASTYQDAGRNLQGALQRRYYLDKQQGGVFFNAMMQDDNLEAFQKLMPYLPGYITMGFTKEQDVVLTDIVLYSQGEGAMTGKSGEVLLDGIPAADPMVIRDHRNSGYKLMVADQSGFLYLISNKGEIEWKLNTPEVVQSELKVIDLYKNGRQQCLFLSRNMIHLVQIDGKYVQGFPVRLSAPFMAHLAVFDYEGNGNYRLVYQSTPGKVANVDLTGQPVAGWSPSLMLNLQRPLHFLKVSGQDHLIACDTAGAVHFLDRRGRERFSTPPAVSIGEKSEMVVTMMAGTSYFAFTDRDGLLQMIAPNGEMETHEVLKFAPGAWLISTDTKQPGSMEFIVVEPHAASLFDAQLKLIRRWEDDGWMIFRSFRPTGDPSVLLAALDASGLPFLLFRNGNERIKLSGKSYDAMNLWRDKAGDPAYLALTKGTMIAVRPL
ncbi:MAG: hypothetical protein R6V49_07830 [Bacteroidales bacterium]